MPFHSDPDGLDRTPIEQALRAAFSVPATPAETTGIGPVLAEYAAAQRPSRRYPLLKKLLTAKAIAIVAASTLGVGTAAAAYSGALPEVAQERAHDVLGAIGVPAKHGKGHAKKSANPSASPSDDQRGEGPDVSGESHDGLCRAWLASGKPTNLDAPPWRNLVAAAGGADGVAAFCADATKSPKPDESKSPKPDKSKSPHPNGSKSPKPDKSKSPHPNGSDHPDGDDNPGDGHGEGNHGKPSPSPTTSPAGS